MHEYRVCCAPIAGTNTWTSCPHTQCNHHMLGTSCPLVDPGALANCTGAALAGRIMQKAIDHGHPPEQKRIPRMSDSGVGDGSQYCNYQFKLPIGVRDGNTQLHTMTAPSLEGKEVHKSRLCCDYKAWSCTALFWISETTHYNESAKKRRRLKSPQAASQFLCTKHPRDIWL